MSAARGFFPGAEAACGRIVGALAQFLAILGGLVLLAITVMTVVSIAGRALISLGFGPVPGDFELVEAGVAFAVFSFLPWCHYRRGHVMVDLFAQTFGPRGLAAFSLVGNFLMTVAAVLIAWRLGLGTSDKLAYGETTFILQFPLWWPYAAALVGAWLFALTAAYTVWRSLNEMLGKGEDEAMRPTGTEWGE